ncbi:hypothetical protein [Streptomyces sp. NPDC001876]|uniref:hypothetical protein n=1 Tax=Streptomyces sp. NPDC001876 TaxID=3154402 RepID=UPI003333AF18
MKNCNAKYPQDKVNQALQVGMAHGATIVGVLKGACKASDPSRDGITAAMRAEQLHHRRGCAPRPVGQRKVSSRNSFVPQPDASIPGGPKSVKATRFNGPVR